MNDKEQNIASVLLEKLKEAESNEVVQFATAYQALCQGALNRKNAEITNK